MNYQRVSIIGAGVVGSTTAFALISRNIPVSITLVDVDETRCHGEILDLSDAGTFSHAPAIEETTFADAGKADIIVIAAGARQKPNQKRTELIAENRVIMKKIIEGIAPINPNAIIIVVSNPVDALTRYIQTIAQLPLNQIFGSGTLLDTQRLRTHVAKKVGLAEESVHAYVLGEHGDSQFAVWSSAMIDETPIAKFPGITQKLLNEIEQSTQNQAYEIIKCKGATYYGIASCVATLCNNIINDSKQIVPLSCYISEYDVCMSMPVVLGRAGIEKIIPVSFNKQEQEKLQRSIAMLKEMQTE